MPKIRIKKASTSYLERFANKSYSTDPNGVTTFTTSGMLNSNYKKALDNFYNSGGKYFKIKQLSKNGSLTDESDFFDDSSTIEFVESTKNNRILDVPVVKIANTDDYYITSDPALLSQNTITSAEAKHDHLKISDRLVSSPNFIDFDSFSENSVPSAKTLSKTKENVKEEDFSPFVEEDIFENVSDSFLTESFVYEDEEYHLGNEQRIEIELDFSDKTDAYLLNTQLFYKTNNFFDTLTNGEPDQSPDDVFVTDQVNFIADATNKSAITSHFIPNAIWNNTHRRWEYNLIEESNNIKLNTYLFNKNLFDNDSAYPYPNLLTHSYDFGEADSLSESNTNENIFNHLKYIATSPIAFTSFSDIKNTLSTLTDDSYIFNTPTKSYGFPNSELWKTSSDHAIQLNKYLPGDFLLEKVIFEGTLDIKAEEPTKKGNFVNHHQDFTEHATRSTSDDAILFSNNTEFNLPHTINSNENKYTAAGVNFYLLNRTKKKEDKQVPKLLGYVFSKETNSQKYSDFTLSANDTNNPYIDLSLNDIKSISNIENYEGSWNNINYTDSNQIKYEPVKASTYNFVSKDNFNNFGGKRLTNKFYYLDDTDLDNIDLLTKNYFSIKSGSIDSTSKIYNTLASNNVTKEIKESALNSSEDYTNELITHNSIAFVNRKEAGFVIEDQKLNSQIVETTNFESNINYADYEFKIADYVRKNNSKNKFLGENKFSITSNYQYNKTTPEVEKKNVLIYNNDKISRLLDVLFNVKQIGFWDASNELFLGINHLSFANTDGLGLAISQGRPNSDFSIMFDKLKSTSLPTSNEVKFQLRYENISDPSNPTIEDFFYFVDSPGDSNFNCNVLNFKCFENNDFILKLLNKRFTNTNIDVSFSLLENGAGDSIYFESLTLENKVLAFTRILDISIFLSKHIIINSQGNAVGAPFRVFSKNEKVEPESTITLDLLNKRIETSQHFNIFTINKDFNLALADELGNDHELSDTGNLLLKTNFDSTYDLNDTGSLLNTTKSPTFFEIMFERNSNINFEIQNMLTKTKLEYSTSNIINLDDEINIFEEKLSSSSERHLYTFKNSSSIERDIVTSSGKIIAKSEPDYTYENYGYLLKPNDEISVGLNSFNGFNNIISYAQIKNKLKITLVGREAYKRNQNDSYYSNSIKKSFSGNQKYDVIQKKDRNGKYFKKNLTNNKTYVSDSVLPDIADIVFTLSQKSIDDTYESDSLDWFLSLDNYSNKSIQQKSTNKIILSNKTQSESKYSNIISDWHNTFYLSKFKDNEFVKNKQLKNSSALVKERTGSLKPTYLYFDIDSYSLSNRYDIAAGFYLNEIHKNLTYPNNFVNSNIINTIRQYALPNEYEIQNESITNPATGSPEEISLYYNHSGLRFNYDSEPYSFNKDSLINQSLGSKVFVVRVSDFSFGASIQYLNIPAKIYGMFNLDEYGIVPDNKNSIPLAADLYKQDWVLVLEDPSLELGTDFYEKISRFKDSNIATFYQKYDLPDTSTEIVYDSTFKLLSKNSKTNLICQHNFYAIFRNETGEEEKLFIVLPLPFVKKNNNQFLTIQTGNNIFYNEFFDIDFTHQDIDKDDFKLDLWPLIYNTVPFTYEDMFDNADPADNFSERYNFSKYLNILGSQSFNITFYYPKYTLNYTQTSNLTDPVFNTINNDTLNLHDFRLYNVDNNLSKFRLLDKKLFLFDKSYYDVLESIIDNTNKPSLYLNKIISYGFIYKKIAGRFVKTNNKVVYEVVNFESYRKNVARNNTFINIIGLLNKSGVYDENDISCHLLYGIENNDVIRIYDEKIKNYDKKFKLNLSVPFIEIDLSTNNPLLDGISGISEYAIKYNHFSVDNFEDVPAADTLKTYGSPIAQIDDTEKVNNFLYSYSRNKKYSFPIDQTSGFRYGVHNPTPVNTSYYFNTNHYGQFKDRSYDTQNYSMIKYVNDRLVETHCVRKRYYDDTKTFIEESIAAQRDSFDGSNTDVYDRVYHPFIESNDGSDMSYLYT